MAVIPNVVGPSWPALSKNQDLERTINFYPETPDGGALAKNPQGALYGTAGLTPFASLPAGPVRALFYQDGRCFGVGGTSFVELFPSGTVTSRGTVLSDDNPAVIASNGSAGNQLCVTSGGRIYIYDLTTDTLTYISAASFIEPAISVVFLDDYFIIPTRGTRNFYISALLDGTSWDVLDVFQVSKFSDNIQNIAVSHEVLWVFGSLHSLPYVDSGDINIPFQPIQQTLVEHGMLAPYSIVTLDNTLYYLSQDRDGSLQVVKLDGYTPVIVSTFGMQTYMATAETADDVVGWSWQEDGHLFYQMYFPHLKTSPVYDVATRMWHERALWDINERDWKPHLGRCHVYWPQVGHLVGDRQSGTVYLQSLSLYQDNVVLNPGTVS